jgi:hypothetical protein
MRKLFVLLIAASLTAAAFGKGRSGSSSHGVRGYTRKNGTYVAPHRQTNANKTQRDNWSTKGNSNPHTGKQGTKAPKK